MAELAVNKQATFLWEGKDKKGNRVKGRGLARDEMEIRSDLRKQGIAATRVRKESKLFKGEGKVTAEDIALFARQLATMLNAGIPMVQSFEIIGVGNDKPAVQKLVLSIKSDIETGNSLHQSLAKHPLYFDDLFVNLVEAGEHAGALETVLEKIATYKEKTEALKKKIKKALFYPAAVLAVAVIVTVILLIFVIPQFESLFKGFGADLPAFTQFVVNMSRWMQAKGWLLLVFVGSSRFHLRLFLQTLPTDAAVHRQDVAADSGDRADPAQVSHRALRPHACNDVRRGRAARRGDEVRRRRHRQHHLPGCRAAHARRNRHWHAHAAGHGEHGPVPEHGGADDRGRRRVGLAGRDGRQSRRLLRSRR